MNNCNFKSINDTPEELAYEQHSQKIINMDNKHGKCVVVRASFIWGFDAGLMHSKNEIEKLQAELQATREQLERAEKVIEFYAKFSHWLGLTDKVPFGVTKWIRIVEDDMDKYSIGGLKARQYFQDKQKDEVK